MSPNGRMEIIMKKTFALEELDCAHCAAKMETAIGKLDGVISASISFMTQKLTIEADENDFDKILKAAQKAIKKIEPDCRIIID
jgi:copper chaperone CopZ